MRKFFLPPKASERIKTEQLQILCQHKFGVLIVSVITALICVYIFWPVIEHSKLLNWFSLVAGIAMIRIAIPFFFKNNRHLSQWARLHIIITFLQGVSWGLLAFFFDHNWPADYQVTLFIVFIGITFASLVSNISVFIAFPAFMLPVMSCLFIVLLQQTEEGYFKITNLILIYMIMIYQAALRYHNQLVSHLEIRSVNEELNNKLLSSNLQLKDMADTDGLTQIANRRTLDKYLTSEWNRHYRNKKTLSFIFLDVDYFKLYNDSYGHQAGDDCLVQIASIISECAKRSSDLVARYGGEEFAVILPETEVKYAQQIAEKIKNRIEEARIPHKASLVSDYVTASLGVVSIIPDTQNIEQSLPENADKALYQAKKQGRNKCVLWEPVLN